MKTMTRRATSGNSSLRRSQQNLQDAFQGNSHQDWRDAFLEESRRKNAPAPTWLPCSCSSPGHKPPLKRDVRQLYQFQSKTNTSVAQYFDHVKFPKIVEFVENEITLSATNHQCIVDQKRAEPVDAFQPSLTILLVSCINVFNLIFLNFYP